MKEAKNNDPLHNIMEVSKEQLLDKDSAFVRDVSASPEFSIFMATKQQLIDIERFCTNAEHVSVFGFVQLLKLENTFSRYQHTDI